MANTHLGLWLAYLEHTHAHAVKCWFYDQQKSVIHWLL